MVNSMKKLSSYLQRTKWAILVVAGLFLAIFGRLIEVPSLTKSSIVLGIGIDYNNQNDEFLVSVQSVFVGASAGDTSQTTYNNYSGNGKTIAGALDDISRKMGLLVSLAHCNVLFLSTNTIPLDHFQLIYPLVVMYELPEHAIIVSGDQSPKDMLAIRMGTTVSAPFFLQSTLYNQEGSNGMIRTTVKDFLAMSMSRSETTILPYISAKKLEDQPMTGQETLKDNYEFDMEKCLAFNHQDYIVIDKKMAEMLALYYSEDVTGVLNYVDDDGGTMEFKILKKDVSIKPNGRQISADMKISLDLIDVQHVNEDSILTGADEIVKRYASALASELSALLEQMFELSKKNGIDFLSLQSKAYQSIGRHLEENCLDTLTFLPSVEISVEEAA